VRDDCDEDEDEAVVVEVEVVTAEISPDVVKKGTPGTANPILLLTRSNIT